MRIRIAILLLISPLATFAHHSRTEYDLDNPSEVTGEILSVSWKNPHIEFRLRASDGSGEWHMESLSAIAMNRSGVPADVLQPGMHVIVAGGASTRRSNRMEVTNILLPDSVELVLEETVSPRWSDNVIGRYAGSEEFQPSGAVPDDGKGIFRVWAWDPKYPWMLFAPSEFPLTDAAREAAADWDEDDPEDALELQCIPPGMPSTMGNPHPMELVELDGVIELRNEEFDVVRQIHMEPAGSPDDAPRSPLGYSVGRWEDDTLIVTTTRLNTPYLSRRGVPQSESAEVTERFTLDADAGHLNYVLVVTDPVNLTEPFVEEFRWVWNERSYLQRFDCTI